jgi:hypothetical protein
MAERRYYRIVAYKVELEYSGQKEVMVCSLPPIRQRSENAVSRKCKA